MKKLLSPGGGAATLAAIALTVGLAKECKRNTNKEQSPFDPNTAHLITTMDSVREQIDDCTVIEECGSGSSRTFRIHCPGRDYKIFSNSDGEVDPNAPGSQYSLFNTPIAKIEILARQRVVEFGSTIYNPDTEPGEHLRMKRRYTYAYGNHNNDVRIIETTQASEEQSVVKNAKSLRIGISVFAEKFKAIWEVVKSKNKDKKCQEPRDIRK